MTSLFSAVKKSFRIPSLEEHVRAAQESELDSEKQKKALFGIREAAERKKNPGELLMLGVVPIMVKALYETKANEVRLWALWVLRFLADYEEAAPAILQEPFAIEGLMRAIKESNLVSESSKRAIECVKHLSKHLSTQMFLAREDVFDTLILAMGAGPEEASAALYVYYTLSEAGSGGSPSYLGLMKKPEAVSVIKGLSHHQKLSEEDKDKAEKLYEHLTRE